METLYQSLVAVEPVTLIANICNLFIQMLIIKKFFLDKVLAILDQRRSAANKEITEAKAAKDEALTIKKTYEDNMLQATAKANEILQTAQKTAAERSEKIIAEAQTSAAQIKSKASADIAQEKKKAINDAKNEISAPHPSLRRHLPQGKGEGFTENLPRKTESFIASGAKM